MTTIAAISKQTYGPLECELISFNGTILQLEFVRNWNGTQATSLRVSDYFTGVLLAENPWPGGMGCAIVKNGVIHIFGSTSWAAVDNKVIHSTLDVNYAPSTPVNAILTNAPGYYKFYNTSVTEDANGYTMIVETSMAIWFARSTDLNTWTFSGGQIGGNYYVGSPTINYVNGVHFITYLKNTGGNFVTQAVKSTDNCFTFTEFNGKGVNPAGSYLLSPGVREGNNTSDASFVEHNGCVYGCYLNGNQATLAEFRKFSYPGTMAQLYSEFF